MVLANQYFVWWAAQVVAIAILIYAFLRWHPGFLGGRSIRQTLSAALQARADLIHEQLRAAEASSEEAARIREQGEVDISEAREEARTIVMRAESTSEAIQRDMQKKAEEEFRRILVQAREEIEYERRQAELALRQRAADIVVDAAGQIVKEYLQPSEDSAIIDDSLERLGNLS